MFAQPRTLADLGFPHLLRALGARCRTEMGRERALARPFLATTEQVRAAFALADEASALATEQGALPLAGLSDVRPLLLRAAKSALLDPRELSAVAAVLSAGQQVRSTLFLRASSAPLLWAIASGLPELERLAARLADAFDPPGELSDRASPALKAARDRVRGLHRAIKARLDELLRDERFSPNLRDVYYSVRNERYVVPVLAQHRAEVPGIVHNASQSGQTLFVEPQELMGTGNELAIAQSLVLEEERRILQELTDEVGSSAPAIATGVDAMAALDEAEATARLSADLGAHGPGLEPPGGALELFQLRHPLLQLGGFAVVPNDLKLAPPLRALIVSGPNAGGKTVTLTAVGLCAAMVKAGLPIPAGAESRVPLFDSIHAAVGDAQDLELGLSTFSAHVVQLKEIGAQARVGALVLLDELAADTDPREGAAIAIAVLEDLLERGAVALVTTHLEELKALAHMDPRFQNARVGFDTARMAPTYRLQLGLAGASSAIEIAARMGLPEAICQRARALSTQAGGPLSRALAEAEQERSKLAHERARLEDTLQEARADRERAQLALQAAENRATQLVADHEARLKRELDEASEELRQVIAELRAKPTLRAATDARQSVIDRSEASEARAAQAQARLSPEAPAPAPLRVGGMARHSKLKQKVEILELDGDEALVTAGPMKMRVPRAELIGLAGQKSARKFPASTASDTDRRVEAASAGALPSGPSTCDVRGQRADDALAEVERFLDRTFRAGESEAAILHGHGTGALKQAIRGYLDGSPYVRMFRPGAEHEGGDGVTIVAFRG